MMNRTELGKSSTIYDLEIKLCDDKLRINYYGSHDTRTIKGAKLLKVIWII